MTDELKQWEYDKGYTKGYSDGRTSLIKDIKTEIEDLMPTISFDVFGNKFPVYDKTEVLQIIDKHISELKGENK